MFVFSTLFPALIIFVLLIYMVIVPLFSTDRTKKFNPLVIIGLVIIYYVVIPFIRRGTVAYGANFSYAEPYMLWASMVYLVSILIGFSVNFKRRKFVKWNNALDDLDVKKVAIAIFLIGFVAYFMFNKFSLNVFRVQEYSVFDENASYGHSAEYLVSLISMFPLALCLMDSARKEKTWVIAILVLSFIIYILIGFRKNLVILVLCFAIFHHLYPRVKKIRWQLWVPVALAFYMLMGVMEYSRNYGNGLDIEKLREAQEGDINFEASENIGVYVLSSAVIQRYSVSGERICFEPIANALLMPIPRAIFPWKPKGTYTRDACIRVNVDISTGAAMITYAEAFISFGWLGIVLYGLALGMLSKLFWSNYKRNSSSLGAVLLLAVFDGIIYMIISRGYLAMAFITFMYYIVIPFWIILLMRKIPAFKLNKEIDKT